MTADTEAYIFKSNKINIKSNRKADIVAGICEF